MEELYRYLIYFFQCFVDIWEWHNDVFNIEEAKKFTKYEDAENYGILIHLKMIYE